MDGKYELPGLIFQSVWHEDEELEENIESREDLEILICLRYLDRD